MIRFRTQDTRAATARKLNALLVTESDAGPFFRFRETPQTYDQWELQLESVRKTLAAAHYDVSKVGQFRAADDRRMRCYRLNRLIEAIAAGEQPYKPEVVALPEVSGTLAVGQELSVDPGEWDADPDEITYTYQWLRDGAPVADETGDTYTLGEDDVDTVISVAVTATNDVGSRTVLVIVGLLGSEP